LPEIVETVNMAVYANRSPVRPMGLSVRGEGGLNQAANPVDASPDTIGQVNCRGGQNSCVTTLSQYVTRFRFNAE